MSPEAKDSPLTSSFLSSFQPSDDWGAGVPFETRLVIELSEAVRSSTVESGRRKAEVSGVKGGVELRLVDFVGVEWVESIVRWGKMEVLSD